MQPFTSIQVRTGGQKYQYRDLPNCQVGDIIFLLGTDNGAQCGLYTTGAATKLIGTKSVLNSHMESSVYKVIQAGTVRVHISGLGNNWDMAAFHVRPGSGLAGKDWTMKYRYADKGGVKASLESGNVFVATNYAFESGDNCLNVPEVGGISVTRWYTILPEDAYGPGNARMTIWRCDSSGTAVITQSRSHLLVIWIEPIVVGLYSDFTVI